MDYVGKTLYPFGAADHVKPAFAATIAVAIENSLTIIEPAQLTGNATLDVTINSEQRVGDRIVLKINISGGAETLTLGEGITGPAIVGAGAADAGKTFTQEFVYDGVSFAAVSAAVKTD